MTNPPERLQSPENRSRLIRHFEQRYESCLIQSSDRGLTARSSIENHNAAWDSLWETDNSDMWDRGKPSPALVDLLEQREDILSPITANGQRKKILVPVRRLTFLFLTNQGNLLYVGMWKRLRCGHACSAWIRCRWARDLSQGSLYCRGVCAEGTSSTTGIQLRVCLGK
jgi:hypothetical protein